MLWRPSHAIRCDAGQDALGGRCWPKDEPWSSRQSLKRPNLAIDASSSFSSSVSPIRPPSSRTRAAAASMSSTLKKRYGLAPGSPPWMPPGMLLVSITALARWGLREPPAEQGAVERASLVGVADSDREEADLACHGSLPSIRLVMMRPGSVPEVAEELPHVADEEVAGCQSGEVAAAVETPTTARLRRCSRRASPCGQNVEP